jgi:putative transposase
VDQSALLELAEAVRTADGGELMRKLLEAMLQAMVDAEATARIGASPHERTETRTTQRNGTRDELVATTPSDLTVKIPKVRAASFFPSSLAPPRRIGVALHAVVVQARVEGVSTRKVDDLVAALAPTRASARARCPASAGSSTLRSPPGGPGRWTRSPSPTCPDRTVECPCFSGHLT